MILINGQCQSGSIQLVVGVDIAGINIENARDGAFDFMKIDLDFKDVIQVLEFRDILSCW